MHYYCGLTYNKENLITNRLYLYDIENSMMFGGDLFVKDIFCTCTFTYFRTINKIIFPITTDQFYSFLYLFWPKVENSDYIEFLVSQEMDEWII